MMTKRDLMDYVQYKMSETRNGEGVYLGGSYNMSQREEIHEMAVDLWVDDDFLSFIESCKYEKVGDIFNAYFLRTTKYMNETTNKVLNDAFRAALINASLIQEDLQRFYNGDLDDVL